MFTRLFFKTIDPNMKWSAELVVQMMLSIFFHTFVYGILCNLVSFIFLGKVLTMEVNKRLVVGLVVFMLFGYFGRIFHTKQVYNALGRDDIKTQNYLNTHYNSWIFLG